MQPCVNPFENARADEPHPTQPHAAAPLCAPVPAPGCLSGCAPCVPQGWGPRRPGWPACRPATVLHGTRTQMHAKTTQMHARTTQPPPNDAQTNTLHQSAHLSEHQAACLAACRACCKAGVHAALAGWLVVQHAAAVLPEGRLGRAVKVHAGDAVIVAPGDSHVVPLVIQPAGNERR